jgi:hydrogenase maturation protein HypF
MVNRRAHVPVEVQDRVRQHLVLTGILQGIGLRPTVYRLATGLGLGGWVVNSSSGVHIEIEGTPEQCRRFSADLPYAIPFPGRIDESRQEQLPPTGEVTFRIGDSLPGERSVTPIPPDVATCGDCVQEVFDAKDRRYLYPFTTCTLCGPRFTVVRSFPYDRERTSMADFTMCEKCAQEYHDPANRRFHSQTNCCPECGPRLNLLSADGEPLAGEPLSEAVRMLRQGKILAVKGIGGFHLACDATNEATVGRLRERKGRAEKPFAVMMADRETVKRFCALSDEEERILTSPVAPIVLLDTLGERLASNVAAFVETLGVMLPYTPLHHLLFRHPEIPALERPIALVMTSGNLSEEPIVRGNKEALERLGGLVDAILIHDREIVLRADDSIVRVIAGRSTVFRRSRGLVPGALKIARESAGGSAAEKQPSPGNQSDSHAENRKDVVVLGCGGDLKNALAIIKGDQAVPGPHVGDLVSPVSQTYFKRSVEVLTEYLEAAPELLAVDPHPEYFSKSLAGEMRLPVDEVFHHHAHAISLLVQHGLTGPCVFAVFDGTGYGTDGTIWGGEFLIADLVGFERVAHIGPFMLPGGEAAIRDPVRILAGLLANDFVLPEEFSPLMGDYRGRVPLWLEAASKGLNSPLTTSAGRLFDAGAAAIGFRRSVMFEGQAAMWLEGIADKAESGEYAIRFCHTNPALPDPRSLILETCRDMLQGTEREKVAARFHNSMARIVADSLTRLAEQTGIETVGLTGGCFQNRLLTEKTVELLQTTGLRLLLHESVPPNDGGIAVGQAVAARERWRRKTE